MEIVNFFEDAFTGKTASGNVTTAANQITKSIPNQQVINNDNRQKITNDNRQYNDNRQINDNRQFNETHNFDITNNTTNNTTLNTTTNNITNTTNFSTVNNTTQNFTYETTQNFTTNNSTTNNTTNTTNTTNITNNIIDNQKLQDIKSDLDKLNALTNSTHLQVATQLNNMTATQDVNFMKVLTNMNAFQTYTAQQYEKINQNISKESENFKATLREQQSTLKNIENLAALAQRTPQSTSIMVYQEQKSEKNDLVYFLPILFLIFTIK